MSRICVSLTEKTLNENRKIAEDSAGYADCFELRADLLEPEEIGGLPGFPGVLGRPCILTLRRTGDGGGFDGPDRDRTSIFGRSLKAGYRWFDFELDYRPGLEVPPPGIIRSYHDISGFPEGIDKIAQRCGENPEEMPKIAVTPESTGELAALLDVSEGLGGRDKIVLGMGAWGFPSRVLPVLFGSYLTYSTAGAVAAAPGHITPKELDQLYRVRVQTSETAVFGILGNPVMHSKSPLIHNAGFIDAGIDAVYVPFQAAAPAAFLETATRLGVRGLSVTVPHKEAVIPLLRQCGEEVTAIGACNTMVRTDGGWAGRNFDAPGFLGPLKEIWTKTGEKHRRALVVGAGGAARAVVYALRRESIEVYILNRTLEKAEALAEEFGCSAAPLDSAGIAEASAGGFTGLIVQTTCAGMHPFEDGDPLQFYSFQGDETVYDIVYAPKETKLLRRASAAGCRTVYGESMLRAQAFLQFREFTGREYPLTALSKYDGIF